MNKTPNFATDNRDGHKVPENVPETNVGKINGRTPEEIKKGILCDGPCNECAYRGCMMSDVGCSQAVEDDTLAYIQQLEERNSKLEYTLLGVMHSVDKWLDVEPYDFDKDDGTVAATRASNAREIALKAIEKLQKELQHERDQIQYTIDAANVMKDEALKLESRLAQVEREKDAAVADWKRSCLKGEAMCWTCKFCEDGSPCLSPIPCEDGERWQWRGICAENTKEKQT